MAKARAADALDPDPAALDSHDLLDRRARDGIDLAVGDDGERRNDGEGERDLEGEDDPLPRPALDVDEAADPFDIGADHIHADAAAGKVGHRRRGREARLEDQGILLRRAQPLGPLGRDQAGGDGAADQLVAVDAAAVVRNLEQYLVAGLARADSKAAAFALAGPPPLGRAFDAVVDRVADDMGERIADHLQHLAVDLDVAAVDLEDDLLAGLAGNVADHPRQGREEVVDPLHPGSGDPVAKVGDGDRDPLEGRDHLGVAGRADPPRELVAGEDEVGDSAHHPVEQLHRKADGPARGAGGMAGRNAFRLGRFGRRLRRQGVDEGAVVLAGQSLAGLQRLDELAETVDDSRGRR